MLFTILATDKPNAVGLRAENRPAHLDYLKSFGAAVVVAGPTLNDDGETPNGSLLVVDMASHAAVEAFCAGDPYAKAGLFQQVAIKPYRLAILNPPAQ